MKLYYTTQINSFWYVQYGNYHTFNPTMGRMSPLFESVRECWEYADKVFGRSPGYVGGVDEQGRCEPLTICGVQP